MRNWMRKKRFLLCIFILMILYASISQLNLQSMQEYDYIPREVNALENNHLNIKFEPTNALKDKIKLRDELLSPKILRNDHDFVIVVQVHNRSSVLRLTVDSLRKVKGINSTLVIFSHDIYDDQLNEIVDSIDFCDTAQIFLPYSVQLNPSSFPGTSPNDCPRDIDPNEAKLIKCNNAEWPDRYHHYREAKYTQIKHHWWWKINTVFDKLEVTKTSLKPFVFIEEDHYMGYDLLITLQQMWKQMKSENKLFLLSMGGYINLNSINVKEINVGEIRNWRSTEHNIGMVIEREVWNAIHKCKDEFCTFDDYNWDWTLNHILLSCVEPKLKVACLKFPRVHHIGLCGVHTYGDDCNPHSVTKRIEQFYKDNAAVIDINKLTLNDFSHEKSSWVTANGGWGDKRDHSLCIKMAS